MLLRQRKTAVTRRSARPAIVALVLSLGVLASAHAGLDRRERTIARHVAEGQPAAEALLQRVVDIESPTENVAGVRAVGDAFAAELRAIGFQHTLGRIAAQT